MINISMVGVAVAGGVGCSLLLLVSVTNLAFYHMCKSSWLLLPRAN